jgi:hypothetical protein
MAKHDVGPVLRQLVRAVNEYAKDAEAGSDHHLHLLGTP